MTEPETQPVTWTQVVAYKDIRYEHSGTGIAKVTINRPETRNAFRPQTVFVSATPGPWEMARTAGVFVEQVVRPTGLVDPQTIIRPVASQVDDLLAELGPLPDGITLELDHAAVTQHAPGHEYYDPGIHPPRQPLDVRCGREHQSREQQVESHQRQRRHQRAAPLPGASNGFGLVRIERPVSRKPG